MEKQRQNTEELAQNNTDFQEEIEQTNNLISENSETQSSNTNALNEEISLEDNQAQSEKTNIEDETNESLQTILENEQVAIENNKNIDNAIAEQEESTEIQDKNCTNNRKQDEMIKNIMTYTCIPFILAAIILSIFNINKMKYPYSFLLLGLGMLDISICNFVRSRKLKLNCNCKNCLKQSNSAFKLSLFLALATVGLIIAFICLIVLK